jgi:hypothetical protein
MKPFGRVALALCLTVMWTTLASAQAHGPASVVSTLVKSAVRDPATYAPAVVKYGAMRLDWISSQTFFRHGFVERNARYTVSGRANDEPMSYRAGNRKIAADSLALLAQSVSANVAERAVEHMLSRRYANHRTLLLVAGHAGRIAGSSYLLYVSSMGHVRQWRENDRLARQMGYR